MTDRDDAMIEAIAGALRPLPRVDDTAKARLLIAVAAEREREREAARARTGRRRVTTWLVSVTAAAAAGILAVTLLRAPEATVAVATFPPTAAPTTPLAAPPATQLASGGDPDAVPQPVQLVFRAPTAANVRVVGDFNAWDKERAPMTRDAETGLWSVTLSLRPGRYVYGFVVDDSLWVRDPRAVAAPDADFGRPGSVLMVGRP